ncbi:hypothetical protein Bca4012_077390 [Brassica carinata]|uniref:Uncharacterized protein n=1 Tax=Brassica carinata TaxID=52824 RepID=A0A8X7Q7S6_BRACI|nr:hypothetical protein Bca52824_072343 [Brassica carinata]
MDSRNPYSQSRSYVGLLNSQNFPYESYPSTLNFGALEIPPFKTCSQTSSTTVGDHEIRPEGIKAAKAKRNNAQGKSLAEYTSIWEMKKKDLMMKEKLSKLAILDTLLAKKEPLSLVKMGRRYSYSQPSDLEKYGGEIAGSGYSSTEELIRRDQAELSINYQKLVRLEKLVCDLAKKRSSFINGFEVSVGVMIIVSVFIGLGIIFK